VRVPVVACDVCACMLVMFVHPCVPAPACMCVGAGCGVCVRAACRALPMQDICGSRCHVVAEGVVHQQCSGTPRLLSARNRACACARAGVCACACA